MNKKYLPPELPTITLSQFVFSPPGPMGWGLTEYENKVKSQEEVIIENPIDLENEANTVTSEFMEFSLDGTLNEISKGLEGSSTDSFVLNSEKDNSVKDGVGAKDFEIPMEDITAINGLEVQIDETPVEKEELLNSEEKEEERLEEIKEPEEENVKKPRVKIIIREQILKGPWLHFPH